MNSIPSRFVNLLLRIITGFLFRVESSELTKIPQKGPLIVVSNHIGSLEVPLLFSRLQPRKIFGLAKVETWDNKFLGTLFSMWDAIPIRRGEADMDAYRRCLDVLREGHILGIAPEGTRSYHGRLQRAQPGTVLIALRTGVPILPLAHWGAESFNENIKKFRRTDFKVRVGTPFILETHGEKVTSALRQEIADEIMGQMAILMPEKYHGEYAGKTKRTKYLKWVEKQTLKSTAQGA